MHANVVVKGEYNIANRFHLIKALVGAWHNVITLNFEQQRVLLINSVKLILNVYV